MHFRLFDGNLLLQAGGPVTRRAVFRFFRATGPSGVLVYNNTFVSPAMALFLNTSAGSHHFTIENNLFTGPETLAGGG